MSWMRIAWTWIIGFAIALLMSSAHPSAADPFVQQPFRVLLGSDLGALEALLVRPSEPGRYPLVLLAHGSPRSPAAPLRQTSAPLPAPHGHARAGAAHR